MRPLYERFIEKLAVIPNACWQWNGAKSPKGYGQVRGPAPQYILYYAHRLAYQYFKGKEPGNADVMHICDNPSCCNPKHLLLGTRKDNMTDAAAKGRTSRGEKRYNAKLSNEKVAEIRKLRGVVTQEKLASRFGVSSSVISVVQCRKTWRHL